MEAFFIFVCQIKAAGKSFSGNMKTVRNMLESVAIITSSRRYIQSFESGSPKISIDVQSVLENNTAVFDIEFTFQKKITAFRDHDYSWADSNNDRIAAEFSSKILRFSDGTFVQANQNAGIWEIKKQNPKVLLWRFNPEDALPYTVYEKNTNHKIIAQANRELKFAENPALLFSSKNAVEFSRSPIPFAAIACFTDHCDFDTAENVKMQREFFNSNGVKVTKGFFLNHFSKRQDNASMQNDAPEFAKWKADGHELAYHSLSQSLKNDEDSFADFKNFVPPFSDIPTWIDHGFQPYNLSLYRNFDLSDKAFADTLKAKNIRTMWNYIDCGTATSGVINQMNPQDFTLSRFNKGNKSLKFTNRIGVNIKNIMFHYYADEKMIAVYKKTAGDFKKLVYQKKIGSFFDLLKSVSKLSVPFLKIVFGWNHHKNKPYRLAKYTPLIFRHRIADAEFYIFQTLEMVDFKKALQPSNIDKLIKEKGIFIAHTYFSVPLGYHSGKMFKNPSEIDSEVSSSFSYLGEKIKLGEVWNPTLNELVVFLTNFENVLLDVDLNGNIIVSNAAGIAYRTVTN